MRVLLNRFVLHIQTICRKDTESRVKCVRIIVCNNN